jgi:hypothetical protein
MARRLTIGVDWMKNRRRSDDDSMKGARWTLPSGALYHSVTGRDTACDPVFA